MSAEEQMALLFQKEQKQSLPDSSEEITTLNIFILDS